MKLNKFYQGDCFDLIKKLANKSVDLVISDGPYGITSHEWDKVNNIQEYNFKLMQEIYPKLKDGGALYLFGKPDCVDFINYTTVFNLKAKIIWYQPARLAQGRLNYTNNYDIICFFIKGEKPKTYNLDLIRVNQLVELSHRKRCENVPSVLGGKFAKTKFNNKGKNPGDVWGDIKQLTYKSKELISRDFLNTIQKPEKLIERMVLASSNQGDTVLDPFSGTGTTAVVCKQHNRNYICFEKEKNYIAAAQKRLGG